MKWKIRDVEINNKIVLAPMAGISNSAFRRIVKELGCGLIYAEMVSDKALTFNNRKTIDMLYMKETERPISQQIFGSDKDSFVEAAQIVYERMKPDIIDINMGCPVPKVALKSQAGSALLKNPKKVFEIVSSVVKSVPIPVTVKIRSGWDFNYINAVEIAKTCERAGASAICVHPRTRSQGYSGKADWDIIKQVKESVQIPVIGNGDVNSALDAYNMIEKTNCDAVMVGRGVLGNPWLIKEIDEYFKNKVLIGKPTLTEKLNMILKHAKYLLEFKSEKEAILEMRSHASWYLKGLNFSKKVKTELFKINTYDDLEKIILEYKEENNEI